MAADNWSIGLNRQELVLTYTPTPVPEPGIPLVLALASSALLLPRRRA